METGSTRGVLTTLPSIHRGACPPSSVPQPSICFKRGKNTNTDSTTTEVVGSGVGCCLINQLPDELLSRTLELVGNSRAFVVVLPAVCKRWRDVLGTLTAVDVSFPEIEPFHFPPGFVDAD